MVFVSIGKVCELLGISFSTAYRGLTLNLEPLGNTEDLINLHNIINFIILCL